MPARIVIVHDDPEFVESTVAALLADGHELKAFPSTMAAINALEAAARRIELLITGVQFPPGQPNGVALARMTRVKRPGVRVLFVARPEYGEHTEGLGELLPEPAPSAAIVQAVNRLLPAG